MACVGWSELLDKSLAYLRMSPVCLERPRSSRLDSARISTGMQQDPQRGRFDLSTSGDIILEASRTKTTKSSHIYHHHRHHHHHGYHAGHPILISISYLSNTKATRKQRNMGARHSTTTETARRILHLVRCASSSRAAFSPKRVYGTCLTFWDTIDTLSSSSEQWELLVSFIRYLKKQGGRGPSRGLCVKFCNFQKWREDIRRESASWFQL